MKKLSRYVIQRVPSTWLACDRHSVAGGVAVGLFVAWLPMPMQTVLAGAISALLRVHVPSSLVMVWFTNPLTMPPLLYIAWLVGTTIITPTPDLQNLSFTLPSVMYAMKYGWPILCVGCLALAVVSSALGYVGVRWAMRDAQQEPPVEIDGQAS